MYRLARSKNKWERRTAIVSTAHFILKLKETAETFALAEILLHDPDDTVNKATGWMLRAAGDIDREAVLKFLEKHAAKISRAALRAAIEKLDKKTRDFYLK